MGLAGDAIAQGLTGDHEFFAALSRQDWEIAAIVRKR
jgi:hypothetical protein